MRFVRRLADLYEGDVAQAGGKAVQCARLQRAGFSVPDGVCVLVDGWERPEALKEAAQELSHGPAGRLYAVRSSAPGEDGEAHSFAGIHETQLNVPADALEDAVRACWRSVRTPRALAYRRGRGLSDQAVTAVLIHGMIAARAAGVAFTRDPVTGRDDVVIEATRGLGVAVVDGSVTPDEYRVRRADLDVTGAEEGALARADVRALAETALRIEALFHAPQDIEWCHDGRGFWFVQSRPITSHAGVDRQWTRANVREVLPDMPPPQVTDAVMRGITAGERAYYGRLIDTERSGPLLRLLCGRIYFNITAFRQLAAIFRMPAAELLRAMGHAGDIPPEDQRPAPMPWRAFVRALPDMARIGWTQVRIESVLRRTLARAQAHLDRYYSGDPRDDSDETIVRAIELGELLLAEVIETVLALAAVTSYEAGARGIIERSGFDADELIHAWMMAGVKSVSGRQAYDLLRLAAAARAETAARAYFERDAGDADYRECLAGTAFLSEFDAFLRQYGHRGNYESDWSLPRYADDPSPLLDAIRVHVRTGRIADPDAMQADAIARRDAIWRRYVARIPRSLRVFRVPLTRKALDATKRRYAWRELCRSEMTRTLGEGRRWHRELARRFADRGWIERRDDYYFVMLPEIFAAVRTRDASSLKSAVAERRADREEWARIDMPLLLLDSDIPRLTRGVRPHGRADLRGMCVSRGVAEGEAIVMRDPGEFRRMKHGAILVATATDPSWTPLFTLAAGVIVEVGGTLSHASTVAREYGIPALANVRDATKLLHDGDRIRLDATSGTVEVLHRAGASE